ncbi:hypothetical protein ACFCX4_27565 [Kitasatospora sp. NPDC056327]|uniref:hypothetical protein n=1 Tax=Kitasatospora sp. NPDC056327 TaxID=3345785 RepID=UPI0035D946C0
MSRTEQELRELYRGTQGMPGGAAKFAALEEVIRHADALGLVEFAFEVRMSATSVFQHSWAPAKAFLTFSWCLAAYDREPERFGGRYEHTLLWQFKWMVSSVHQYPDIPLRRAADLLDDMERRYRRGGHSLHAVLQHRGLMAESVGDLAGAQDFYERMALTRRDALSDCDGCVPSSQVRTLVALGRDEEAVRIGEPARRSGCTEQPQWINSELLLPYLRTGRGPEAAEAHRVAYRRIRDSAHHIGELASNLLFCVQSGNPGRGLDLIERHLSWLDRARTPLAGMEFAAAAVAVLSAVEATGDGALRLRFPTVEGVRRADTPVSALAAGLREHVLGLADRFDARNGNDHQSTRMREWMTAGPIGEPVALAEGGRDPRARSGERLHRLADRVAALTVAGDPAGAARARAELASNLLADDRFGEAAEAAEEAVRELDRHGRPEEAAGCRWLLVRIHQEGDRRGEAAERLRELLAGTGDGAARAAGLPSRPELEARLGGLIGYGEESAARYLAAARGFTAAGRRTEALGALVQALWRHPYADTVAETGLLGEILAEARAALDTALAAEPPEAGPADATEVVAVLRGYVDQVRAAGRHREAAERLSTARALLESGLAGAEAAGTDPARAEHLAEELGEVLAELAEEHLRLGDPAAAEVTARAALGRAGNPDADEAGRTWDAALLLVRVLRVRGATEEAAALMAAHDLTEEEVLEAEEY